MVLVIADDKRKSALLTGELKDISGIVWIRSIDEIALHKDADIIIDLLFEEEEGHLEILNQSGARLVLINSVVDTLSETNPEFIRFNGWDGFLEKQVIEASGSKTREAEEVFAVFGKTIQWLPDTPGFVSPRVICMIINEAYLALEEGVSSRDEMNIAMKMGTNYPYGPFEWADLIGIEKVQKLLQRLSEEHPRYQPAKNISAK